MSSILNSISSGDLLVRQVPRGKPAKKNSIELQNSEIEFKTCLKQNNIIGNINTGFGENNDLYFETKCKSPKLKTPLYLENYLREFVTEEEKAAARHALGLYNKNDVVAMSLLTTKDNIPSSSELNKAAIKLLCLGDLFFTPITQFKAVFDSSGKTLDTHLKELNTLITTQQKEIVKINSISNSNNITSLGDVKLFLEGFNNGDNLHNTLDEINQDMLRFENTGLIN